MFRVEAIQEKLQFQKIMKRQCSELKSPGRNIQQPVSATKINANFPKLSEIYFGILYQSSLD